ncbi:MAG: SMI1/KNR4 family protein [Vulcanimicrobiaceae bacterium]
MDDVIEDCERSIGVALPPSFCEFLRVSNGVIFYVDGADDFKILGTQAVVLRTLERKAEFADRARDDPWPHRWGSLIVFADWGDGNLCVLDAEQSDDATEYKALDAECESGPDAWREVVIADSFESWLAKVFDAVLLRHEIPEYWLGAQPLFSPEAAE